MKDISLCSNMQLYKNTRQTWHEFGFFPKALKLLCDEPAEGSSTGLLFTIKQEIVLHKHFLVCVTGHDVKDNMIYLVASL